MIEPADIKRLHRDPEDIFTDAPAEPGWPDVAWRIAVFAMVLCVAAAALLLAGAW